MRQRNSGTDRRTPWNRGRIPGKRLTENVFLKMTENDYGKENEEHEKSTGRD